MKTFNTGSWTIALPVTIILMTLGMITGSHQFFAAGIIPIVFVLASSLTSVPDPGSITLDREVETEAPGPGQSVDITVTITNTGGTTITDCRVVDAVPSELAVHQGAPRTSVSLTPGASASFTYTVTARRGEHWFGDADVEVRSLFADKVRQETQPVSGDDKILCKAEVASLPLQDKTVERVGNVITDTPGSGVEFHSLREYHPSDPRKRIEWHHLAKTGNLTTKNFREERAAKVILLVDARRVSDVRARDGDPTGIEMSRYAARQAYDAILASRHEPGLGILGIDPTEIRHGSAKQPFPYLPPGRSKKRQQKVKESLAGIEDAPKEGMEDIASSLVSVLPPAAQIVLFTPLLDDTILDALTVLDSYGFPVTVVSPDVTRDDDPFNQLTAIERDIRIKRARRVVPLIDWDIEYPLARQIANTVTMIEGDGR